MKKDEMELVKEWVIKHQQISFKIDTKFSSDTGRITKESALNALSVVVDPIFKSCGRVMVLGSKFGLDAFGGEGADVSSHIYKTKEGKFLLYKSDFVKENFRFFSNMGNDFLLTDLRGTLIFEQDIDELLDSKTINHLVRPYILRNYKVGYSKSTLNFINKKAKEILDGKILIAVSDRFPFSSLDFFGQSSSLHKVIEVWHSEKT